MTGGENVLCRTVESNLNLEFGELFKMRARWRHPQPIMATKFDINNSTGKCWVAQRSRGELLSIILVSYILKVKARP